MAISKRTTLEMLRTEVLRLAQYPDEVGQIESFVHGDHDEKAGHSFSARYVGDWEVPADETDDGDYDFKVPTKKSREMLDRLVAKYPGTSWRNEGEKCWLAFFCK